MTGNQEAIIGRHSRAIRILTCLQSGPTFNAKELAERLQVSRRTIYRDLNLIRGAGFRVEFDDESAGYRVAHASPNVLAPPGFSDRDVAKLALTSHLSMLHGFSAFGASVRESVARLLGHYPPRIRESITRLLNCCSVDLPRPAYSRGTLEVIETLLSAIGHGKAVRLAWSERAGDELRWTKFAPYRMIAGLEEWQIVGRSTYHRRTVRFAASQIAEVHLTNDTFRIPAGFRTRQANGDYRGHG